MSEAHIAFWSTVAQIAVVLALAMVVQFSRIYSLKDRDSGWLSYKLGATVGIVSGFISIGAALLISVNALESGHATLANQSQAITGLVVGFVVGVGWPASLLLLRVWFAPRDPDNPEPPSLPVIVWRLVRRKRQHPPKSQNHPKKTGR